MAKVSVLMNCYNGEKYLRLALDSIFSQTFKDWNVVFIDNCSTDYSAAIARSYGPKVEIYSTPKNISLGAARHFGMEKCKSEYIAFLDTDDIWLPTMLNEQLRAIESGNYVLTYTGSHVMDKDGNHKSTYIPKFMEGCIFGQLLKDFNVPQITTMIRREALVKENLNFNPEISTSVEYSLIMPLAVNNQFIVIPKALAHYRVYSDSLTSRNLPLLSEERFKMLNGIIRDYPGVENKYKDEFKLAFARGQYFKAKSLVSENKIMEARKVLNEIKFLDYRYFVLYLTLFFPKKFWDYLQKLKYNR